MKKYIVTIFLLLSSSIYTPTFAQLCDYGDIDIQIDNSNEIFLVDIRYWPGHNEKVLADYTKSPTHRAEDGDWVFCVPLADLKKIGSTFTLTVRFENMKEAQVSVGKERVLSAINEDTVFVGFKTIGSGKKEKLIPWLY